MAPPGLRYTKRNRLALSCVVWWDYDNAALPRGVSTDVVIRELMTFCSSMARSVTVTAFGNHANLAQTKRSELERAGVHFVAVASKVVRLWLFLSVVTDLCGDPQAVDHKDGRSEEVDKEMIASMAPALRTPGDVCVIITGDHGFHRPMLRLVQQGATSSASCGHLMNLVCRLRRRLGLCRCGGRGLCTRQPLANVGSVDQIVPCTGQRDQRRQAVSPFQPQHVCTG